MWEQLPEGIEIVTKQSPRRDHDNISPYISRKVQRCPQYVRVSRGFRGVVERPNAVKRIFTQAEKEEIARLLYERGRTYLAVAQIYEVDKNSLVRMLQKAGLFRPQRGKKAMG